MEEESDVMLLCQLLFPFREKNAGGGACIEKYCGFCWNFLPLSIHICLYHRVITYKWCATQKKADTQYCSNRLERKVVNEPTSPIPVISRIMCGYCWYVC